MPTPKKKMTLEKLAQMSQGQFADLQQEMNTGFASIRDEMATKADLRHEIRDLRESKRMCGAL
jgi:hypothetical protein